MKQRQQQIELEKPKFIRDNMQIDDIQGVRSKRFIRGVAKDILGNADIDGSTSKTKV